MSVSPFVEDNQGLLALIAIGIAIFIAWNEAQHTKQARRDRVTEPATVALEIINQTIVACERGKGSVKAADAARKVAGDGVRVIDLIADTAPPSAKLIIALVNTSRALERFMHPPATDEASLREKTMASQAASLAELREGIERIVRDHGGTPTREVVGQLPN